MTAALESPGAADGYGRQRAVRVLIAVLNHPVELLSIERHPTVRSPRTVASAGLPRREARTQFWRTTTLAQFRTTLEPRSQSVVPAESRSDDRATFHMFPSRQESSSHSGC